MTKDKYFSDIEKDLLGDKIFLTNRTDLLDQEIAENLWAFSLTKELADQIDSSDFLGLLDKIKADRQEQLNNTEKIVDLIYYLWHDEQAGQLRLNFINSNHDELPFGCNLDMVETEKEIIEDFLKSKYLDIIPMSDMEIAEGEADNNKDEQDKPLTLKVYSQTLKKKK